MRLIYNGISDVTLTYIKYKFRISIFINLHNEKNSYRTSVIENIICFKNELLRVKQNLNG